MNIWWEVEKTEEKKQVIFYLKIIQTIQIILFCKKREEEKKASLCDLGCKSHARLVNQMITASKCVIPMITTGKW